MLPSDYKIALAINENFSEFFNIFSLNLLGYGFINPRAGFSLHFPALDFIAIQQIEL